VTAGGLSGGGFFGIPGFGVEIVGAVSLGLAFGPRVLTGSGLGASFDRFL